MSLQERTLVVKNFDAEKTTNCLLKELCIQGGPVKNVVMRSDHAFVEFEDIESVGYTKALLDGVELFGKKLILEPKLRSNIYFKYTHMLNDFIKLDQQRLQQIAIQNQQLAYQQNLLYAQQRSVQMNPLNGPLPTTNPIIPLINQTSFNYNPFASQQQPYIPNTAVNQTMPAQPAHNLMRSQTFSQSRHHPYQKHPVRPNRSFSDKDRWNRRA